MEKEIIPVIIVIALVTFTTRIIPFLFFKNLKDHQIMVFIGKYLPVMVMPILVVYCLRDVAVLTFPWAVPEISSVALTVLIHLWKRNALLSIGVSTAFYIWFQNYGITLMEKLLL